VGNQEYFTSVITTEVLLAKIPSKLNGSSPTSLS